MYWNLVPVYCRSRRRQRSVVLGDMAWRGKSEGRNLGEVYHYGHFAVRNAQTDEHIIARTFEILRRAGKLTRMMTALLSSGSVQPISFLRLVILDVDAPSDISTSLPWASKWGARTSAPMMMSNALLEHTADFDDENSLDKLETSTRIVRMATRRIWIAPWAIFFGLLRSAILDAIACLCSLPYSRPRLRRLI